MTHEPNVTVPGADALAPGDGPSFSRILVPIGLAEEATEPLAVAARICRSANGALRLLHVRIYDPPEVASAIAAQAAAWPADMIVMTRRTRPALSRLLLGSINDKVMRMASCPVLAVHPRPKVARNAIR